MYLQRITILKPKVIITIHLVSEIQLYQRSIRLFVKEEVHYEV
jgi:hypothetical protein